MAASRGPHVKDIFSQKSTPSNNFVSTTYPATGFHFDKSTDDTKPKPKSTKKTAAPSRPKFGDYKPKILQVDSVINVPVPQYKPPSAVPKEKQNGFGAKPLIIGDKDVPIVIEPIEPIDDDVYTEISDYSLSDEAARSIHDGEQTTTNPLFDNGAKTSHDRVVESHKKHSSSRHTPRSVQHQTVNEEINGVSVPEPDYEEDEVTMDFDGEVEMDQDDTTKHRPKSVYKDFQGEDFSKYLNDELESEPNTYRQRRNGNVGNQTEGKRYKKRDGRTAQTMFGSTSKHRQFKSGSVRNYSVEDTKLGLAVDGTVKGNSLRNGVNYGTTYETFLNSRHGAEMGNGGMDNRGLDTSIEESYNIDKKQTLWKKFTWRLKRQIVLMH